MQAAQLKPRQVHSSHGSHTNWARLLKKNNWARLDLQRESLILRYFAIEIFWGIKAKVLINSAGVKYQITCVNCQCFNCCRALTWYRVFFTFVLYGSKIYITPRISLHLSTTCTIQCCTVSFWFDSWDLSKWRFIVFSSIKFHSTLYQFYLYDKERGESFMGRVSWNLIGTVI